MSPLGLNSNAAEMVRHPAGGAKSPRPSAIGRVDKLRDKIEVVGAGSGGMAEMAAWMRDSEVMWAILRFDFGSGAFQRSKVLFLHFNGESVPMMKRGKANALTRDAMLFIKGGQGEDNFHASIECKQVQEITAEQIMVRVAQYFVVDSLQGSGDTASMVRQYHEQLHRERIEAEARAQAEVQRLAEEREQRKLAARQSRRRTLQSARKSIVSQFGLAGGAGRFRLLFQDGKSGLKDIATGGIWNWILFGPDAKALPLISGGSGSVEEMQAAAKEREDEIMFGVVRLSFGKGRLKRTKFAFVHIIGEKVPVVKRGKLNAQRTPMEKELRRFVNCQIAFYDMSVEDLDVDEVISRVRKVSVVDEEVLDGLDCGENPFSKAAFEAALKEEQEQAEAKVAAMIEELGGNDDEEDEAVVGDTSDEEETPSRPAIEPNMPPNYDLDVFEILHKVRNERSCNWALFRPKGLFQVEGIQPTVFSQVPAVAQPTSAGMGEAEGEAPAPAMPPPPAPPARPPAPLAPSVDAGAVEVVGEGASALDDAAEGPAPAMPAPPVRPSVPPAPPADAAETDVVEEAPAPAMPRPPLEPPRPPAPPASPAGEGQNDCAEVGSPSTGAGSARTKSLRFADFAQTGVEEQQLAEFHDGVRSESRLTLNQAGVVFASGLAAEVDAEDEPQVVGILSSGPRDSEAPEAGGPADSEPNVACADSGSAAEEGDEVAPSDAAAGTEAPLVGASVDNIAIVAGGSAENSTTFLESNSFRSGQATLEDSAYSRAKLGDRVEIVIENEMGRFFTRIRKGTTGCTGEVIEDDFTEQPFLVKLEGGKEAWYKARWLRVLN